MAGIEGILVAALIAIGLAVLTLMLFGADVIKLLTVVFEGVLGMVIVAGLCFLFLVLTRDSGLSEFARMFIVSWILIFGTAGTIFI